jgi:predicted DNA-binding protein (MmcQ/YjbR family)
MIWPRDMPVRKVRSKPKPTRTPRFPRGDDPVTRLRAICMAFPGAVERISHGEPTWFSGKKGKAFAMLDDHHHGASHLSVWLAASLGAQETLVQVHPRRYFRPPYVGHRGWVGVVLDTTPDWQVVTELVEEAYREVSRKRPPPPVPRLS